MIGVNLASQADFAGWRDAARSLLAKDVGPEEAVWTVGGSDLFAGFAEALPSVGSPEFRVAARFVELAKFAICHSDGERFALLYRLLFRSRREPGLIGNLADPDVARLGQLAKSVSRDRHKMTAFVRFRETNDDSGRLLYVAWFEPQHHIEELSAPFFVDRYAQNNFVILTPKRSILFRNGELSFGPGARKADVVGHDGFSSAWNAYYRSMFNPARLMPNAMRKEMPMKYWANLPETQQIPDMMAAAGSRVDHLLALPAAPPTRRRAKAPEPIAAADASDLSTLRRDAETCRRCDLGAHATQTVFGEGPADAKIMFVGEQPGDQEDLAGVPFVGPAGALFNEAMTRAGLLRAQAYVTGAVKHFKFAPRGKKRLHKTADTPEILACKWWLEKELAAVSAPLIVAMGATALFSLTGERGGLLKARGQLREFRGRRLFVTVHPAYVLRLPDAEKQAEARRQFFEDFRSIAGMVKQSG